MVDFKNEQAMFDYMQQRLSAALVSDVLDSLGARHQVMRADIAPVYPDAALVGRAYPVVSMDVYQLDADPYRGEIEAVDSLKPGDVIVWCTHRSTHTCIWGELLSTAARARGARGAVIDGYTRDVKQISEMRFPVFAAGRKPVDSAGRSMVVAHGGPVSCGDVLVKPGDIVFADIDGIAVIPSEIEKEVIPRALEKAGRENLLRAALLKGTLLREAYDRFKTL